MGADALERQVGVNPALPGTCLPWFQIQVLFTWRQNVPEWAMSQNNTYPFKGYSELLLHAIRLHANLESAYITEIDMLVLKHWKDVENQQIFRAIYDSIEYTN